MFKDLYHEYEKKIQESERSFIKELQKKFPILSDEDCKDLIHNDLLDVIKDIKGIYTDWKDAGYKRAYELGYVKEESEKYFKFQYFINDLMNDDRHYIELISGKIIYIDVEEE